jgi:DNA-binding PadR family transcriptional regulator
VALSALSLLLDGAARLRRRSAHPGHHVATNAAVLTERGVQGGFMRRDEHRVKELMPLTPAVFHILLALADGERHGYGIMREIEFRTGGETKLGPGTLYGSIKRMLSDGLIEEAAERRDPSVDDERRRYYKLTGLGRRVAIAEAVRLQGLVTEASAKKLLRI